MVDSSTWSGLAQLSDMHFVWWLVWLAAFFWVNARTGLPHSALALKLRGAGFALFIFAAVLSFGRELVGIYPGPKATAVIGVALAPVLMAFAARKGWWGVMMLALISWPLFGLVALTAFFGLLLDLRAINSILLLMALGLTVWGCFFTKPDPAATDGFAFGTGKGGFRGGFAWQRPGPGPVDSEVVDVDARTVEEAAVSLPSPTRGKDEPPAA